MKLKKFKEVLGKFFGLTTKTDHPIPHINPSNLEELLFSEVAESTVLYDMVNGYENVYDGLLQSKTVLANWNHRWIDKPSKKIILTNSSECCERTSVKSIAFSWRGTSHPEWEFLLATWFVLDVVQSFKTNTEADITNLFNKDLLSYDAEDIFTQDQIRSHLMRFFVIEDETETEVKLFAKIAP